MKTTLTLALAIILLVGFTSFGTNLAVNPGFEIMETTQGGWPSSYGDWNGDKSAIIVGATSGITPLAGSQMLQYLGTSFYGAGSATTCQVYQIIDVSDYTAAITAGTAKVIASAYFNRVAGDAQTDTKFDVPIYAYQGSPSNFPHLQESLAWIAVSSNPIFTDSNPLTWEKCTVELVLPTNTDFVVIGVDVGENIYNDYSSPEFDGHFADVVSVEVVPEPVTMLLLGLGALALRKRGIRI